MIDIGYMVRYLDLPTRTRGVTVEDDNGFFNIYINSKLSVEMQKEALEHELRHIQRNDFATDVSLLAAELS